MHRFYINCDGIDKELFKVVETRNYRDHSCFDMFSKIYNMYYQAKE